MDIQSIEEARHEVPELDLAPESLDAVFSNAVLHWCKKSPYSVAKNAHDALKPGGRFVAEMGGFANVVGPFQSLRAVESHFAYLCCEGVRSSLYRALSARGYDAAALDPWYFPSDTTYRTLLENAGFKVESIGLFPRMTYVPNGLKAWLVLFARYTMLSGMDDKAAEEVIDEVTRECEVDMKDEQGRWCIMYVRLRFRAIKPEK